MNSPKVSSKKAYYDRVRAIARKLGHDDIPSGTISSWLTTDALEMICSKYKDETCKGAYIALLSYLQDDEVEFRNYLTNKRKEVTEKIIKAHELGVKSDKDVKLWKTREELVDFFYKYLVQFDKKPTKSLFVVLFYLYPFVDNTFAVLRNDLVTLQLGKTAVGNYYDGIEIRLNIHKNDRHCDKDGNLLGAFKIAVPVGLKFIFDKWIYVNDINEGDMLTPKTSKMYVTKTLTKYIGISTQMLRKIYESGSSSETLEDFNKLKRELEDTSKKMGHSFATSSMYYIKK